jgi:hypothetical protein
MGLRDATRAILGSTDPAGQLRLADGYLDTFRRAPDTFALPEEHAYLMPIVESYHSDEQTFARYIGAVRDQYPAGREHTDLHELYLTVVARNGFPLPP